MSKFPFFQQMDRMDCGPTCLRMIARHYGRAHDAQFLREKCAITRQGVSFAGIAEAAEAVGMSSLAVQVGFETLRNEVPLPCIAHWRQRHFVVVYSITRRYVHVADPGFGLIRYNHQEFVRAWLHGQPKDEGRGHLLLLEPTPAFGEVPGSLSETHSGLRMLLPYFRAYRALFVQLFLCLFVGSAVQLVLPFLTQAMVDYGIDHQDLRFVYLLLLGQLALFTSQTTVNVVRGWLLLHIGSRVNIRIISSFLMKLMRLQSASLTARQRAIFCNACKITTASKHSSQPAPFRCCLKWTHR